MLALALALQVHTALGEVNACLRADDGTHLIATGGGLAVVGGDVLTALDGLPGTRSLAVAAAGEDLWVGTEAGLARVRRAGRRLQVTASWPSAPVRGLAVQGGTVWLATWGDGLLALRGGRLVGIAGARELTSVVVHDGAVYAGSAGEGVFRVSAAGGGERLEPAGMPLPSPAVFALGSSGGRLLVGTTHGLVVGGSFLGGADVRAIHGDLIGTYGEGLQRLEGGRLREVPGSPAFVTALGDGCVGGPQGLAGARLPGPPANDLSALAVAGERVVVGTFDRGAATLERGAWRAIDGIDPRVNDLALQGSRLWIATARGLFVREGRRLRRVAGLPSDDVHAVLPLRDGRVAVGTAKGAALLRGRKVVLLGAKQGLPIGGAVWALAEGGDGSLWLGSSRGLYRVPPRGRFTRLSMAGGHLPDDWITAIAIHEGTVYAGTYRRGVVRLTSGEAGWNGEPLGGGYVNFHGLRLEDGRLFAATMHGLKSRALDAAAWDPPRKTLGPDVTGFAGGWVATRRGLQRL